MSPVLTRRGLVQAGSAVLGAMVAPIAARAASVPMVDPDTNLLSLIASHPEMLAACAKAEDEADLRARDALAAHPPWPEALNWQSTDFMRTSYGRAASDPIGDEGRRRYVRRGVEWLRTSEFVAQWTEAAEARRQEIIRAHDSWHAECREIDVCTGFSAAEEAKRAAVTVLRQVEGEIGETEAHTLPGLRAKALWVADHIVADPYADEDLGVTFARQVAAFGRVAS